jgi:hypothetical protein
MSNILIYFILLPTKTLKIFKILKTTTETLKTRRRHFSPKLKKHFTKPSPHGLSQSLYEHIRPGTTNRNSTPCSFVNGVPLRRRAR